jgi:hypothetical protein
MSSPNPKEHTRAPAAAEETKQPNRSAIEAFLLTLGAFPATSPCEPNPKAPPLSKAEQAQHALRHVIYDRLKKGSLEKLGWFEVAVLDPECPAENEQLSFCRCVIEDNGAYHIKVLDEYDRNHPGTPTGRVRLLAALKIS